MRKRLALLLCAAMLLSLFPAGEHAHAHWMYDEQVQVYCNPSSAAHGGTFDVKMSFDCAIMDFDIDHFSITSAGIVPYPIDSSFSVRLTRDRAWMVTFSGVTLKSDADTAGDDITVEFKGTQWPLSFGTRTGASHDFTMWTTLTVVHSYQPVSSGSTATHNLACVCGRVSGTEAHTWNAGTVVTSPDCATETNGSRLYTCTLCGMARTESIPFAHTWGAFTSNSDGTHVRECSVCRRQDWQACTYSQVVSPPTCEAAGHTTNTCTVCGYRTFSDYTNPLNHDWGQWVSNNDGTHTRTCANDASHTETASCTYGHAVTPPTCTGGGFTTNTCTACGYFFTDTIVDPLGHDWGAWISNGNGTHTRTCAHDATHIETAACAYGSIVTPPTCTAAGFTTHTCSACGHSFQDTPMAALGHAWSPWASNDDGTHTRTCASDPLHTETMPCAYGSAVIPPTCLTAGFTTHTCADCGHSFQDTPMAAPGHDWGAWVSNDDGTHTRTCANDPLHKETGSCAYADAVTPPTCLAAGFTTHTCSACGHTYQDTPVVALGHDWGPWVPGPGHTHRRQCLNDPAHAEIVSCPYAVNVTPPDCEMQGFTAHACPDCGRVYLDSFTDATGHDWGAWVSNDDGTHTRTCANDPAHSQTEPCAYGSAVTPPTCLTAGFTTHTCSVCAHSYQDTPTAATGHAWGAWVSNDDGTHTRACANDPAHTETAPCAYGAVVTPPTCLTAGFTTHTCSVCAHSYTDTPVNATGHAWDAWASNGDGTHTRICGNDPAHAQTEACAYGSAVTPPTCTEAGFTTHTCSVCAHSYQDTPVNATGHAWGAWASNGDGTHTTTCGNDPAHTVTENCLYELVVTPPACTAPGISTYTCLTCAYRLQQDPTDPLGHAWGSWGSNGDGTHTRACANDPAHTQTEACAYGSVVTPPTCTEAGFTTHTCPVCAHAYQDTPTAATGHAWANWLMNGDGTHTRICANDASHTETVPCTYSHIVVPPGCTSGGYTINMCIVCSHVYFDAHVGALGHDWGAWAANGDGTHTRACARNHAHTESEPCAYGQAVTPPTCTESGFTTHTCAGCGHSFDDTPVPASGHAWGPWLLNGSDTHTRTCGSDPAHQETRDFGIPWIDRVWAEPLGGTSIKVSWNGGPGAQGYEVWYGESLNGPWKLARATGDTAYAKTYLEPGVRYWFKARAYVTEEGARVCAAFSPPVCGVPLAKAKITEAFASGATRIRLAWEPVPGATGYVVSVAATSVGPYEPRVTTTATACTLTGLSPGTAYFLKVTPHARIFGTTYSGIPSGYRSVKTLPM